jgi:hypothetical protein
MSTMIDYGYEPDETPEDQGERCPRCNGAGIVSFDNGDGPWLDFDCPECRECRPTVTLPMSEDADFTDPFQDL